MAKADTKTRARTTTAPLPIDPQEWIRHEAWETTEEVQIPRRLIDQVIGQDDAVRVATKAAEQGRNLLLIGDPGTGKSMLARAMTEVLPKVRLPDTVVYHNKADANSPRIAQVEGGKGRPLLRKYERLARRKILLWQIVEWGLALGTIAFGVYMWIVVNEGILAFLFSVLIALLFVYFMSQNRPKKEFLVPKLLIEHGAQEQPAPYVDGTGSHAGALLGDVRHDPYQSGGLETPAHVRVDPGAIHRAHKGVLFIDEINVLRLQSQQALLTAMQDNQYSIVGQSQNSSGANIRSEPVPCDFLLVAAGNLDAVQPPDAVLGVGMHPALRSRIRGYGYEVYVNDTMEDSHENRLKMCQFVAQEVQRDGRIPHFDKEAVAEIIRESQRRSGRNGKLTLRLRELGGLVRTAGDMARTEGAETVLIEHVRLAKTASRSLEQQITHKEIEAHLDGESGPTVRGTKIGTASGVAIVGSGEVGEPAGLVVLVEAAVVPALSKHGGAIEVGKRLRTVEGSSVDNVSAVLKTFAAGDLVAHDVHVDARITHPEADADGIGLAIAVAAISAVEGSPLDQTTAYVAEIAVTGNLRPVRATTQRIESALDRGFQRVIIPSSIADSLLIEQRVRDAIEIVPCSTIAEVLDLVLNGSVRSKKAIVKRLEGPATATVRNGSGTGRKRTKTSKD